MQEISQNGPLLQPWKQWRIIQWLDGTTAQGPKVGEVHEDTRIFSVLMII